MLFETGARLAVVAERVQALARGRPSQT
jgi:hypothetical protein